MCYLCLKDQFQLEMPKSKLINIRERMLEIKNILQPVDGEAVCDEGDKVIKILREEQYKLSREL